MSRQIKTKPVPGWVSLAHAVVEQAAKDLRWSRTRLKHPDPKIRLKAQRLYNDCIKFFTGPNISMYTDLDGSYLLNRILNTY